MPNDPTLTPIQTAWLNFVTSARVLFAVQPDDRTLDQYLQFRDEVFSIIENQNFLKELQGAWAPLTNGAMSDIGGTLLMELSAFSRAVEVASATAAANNQPKNWLSRWIPRASTVAGSVSDLLASLPPYAKGALTLFKELCSLFESKE